jgi:hypothetical protein
MECDLSRWGFVGASIGTAVVFSGGVYISRQILKALAAPPVPASATGG